MTTKKILTTMPNDGRPYVLESAAFRMSVHQYRQDAQREIDALDGEITRLQAELEARMTRRQDLVEIVILSDMVLEQKAVTSDRS